MTLIAMDMNGGVRVEVKAEADTVLEEMVVACKEATGLVVPAKEILAVVDLELVEVEGMAQETVVGIAVEADSSVGTDLDTDTLAGKASKSGPTITKYSSSLLSRKNS